MYTVVRDDPQNRRIKIISQMSKARGSSKTSSRVFRVPTLFAFSHLLSKQAKTNHAVSLVLNTLYVISQSQYKQVPCLKNRPFYVLNYLTFEFLLGCMRFFRPLIASLRGHYFWETISPECHWTDSWTLRTPPTSLPVLWALHHHWTRKWPNAPLNSLI